MAAAAARKGTPKKAKASWRVGKRSGFIKATVSLTREQFDAIRDEAKRRADQKGAIRADASEVVREALAAWLAKRR